MKRILVYLVLNVALLMLLIALNAQMRRTAAAEQALTEGTLAAVTRSAAELESLTLAMEKLLVTASLRQKAALLSEIAVSAAQAQSSISALPDQQGQRASVLAYLTRLGHLCGQGVSEIAGNGSLSDSLLSSLAGMHAGLQLLQAEFSLASQDMLTGARLAGALPATGLTLPPTALEMASYKALPSQEVSAGTAMQLAKEFVGEDRVLSVSHAPDTSGAMPAYGVTLQTRDVQLNAEVTRQGGKILLMVPETAAFPMEKSIDACRDAALTFLQSRGFAPMEVCYYQVYNGLCVLTCTYVQNGVLVWADRVLVQVRMDTAEVVGIEARSYWKNHTPRKFPAPLLSEAEARGSLSSAADVLSARLCLLPHQTSERLCWQFTLSRAGETYVSYIDAFSGEELLIEKVMQLEFGTVAA